MSRPAAIARKRRLFVASMVVVGVMLVVGLVHMPGSSHSAPAGGGHVPLGARRRNDAARLPGMDAGRLPTGLWRASRRHPPPSTRTALRSTSTHLRTRSVPPRRRTPASSRSWSTGVSTGGVPSSCPTACTSNTFRHLRRHRSGRAGERNRDIYTLSSFPSPDRRPLSRMRPPTRPPAGRGRTRPSGCTPSRRIRRPGARIPPPRRSRAGARRPRRSPRGSAGWHPIR